MTASAAETAVPRPPLARLALAAVLTGVLAGLAVAFLVWVIHLLEHAVWGEGHGPFLDNLPQPPRWLPLLTVTVAGILAAGVWYAIRRWSPVPSVEAGVAGKKMPFWATIADTVVQVVSVGLGASIGKEVAPRELSAMLSGRLVGWFRLDARWSRVLVAAGAGAGLAGVYNVPLAGAIFALEILLAELAWDVALVALAVSGIATLVSRPVVGGDVLYHVGPVHAGWSLMAAAVVVGLVLGLAARSFTAVTGWLGRHKPSGARLLLVLPPVFAAVGLLGVFFPLVLGNGRAMGQAAMDGATPVGLLLALAVAKYVATLASLGAGATGGTLQPSVAIGGCLGAAFASVWARVWPGAGTAELAIVGSAAFLAATMKAPFTAIFLLVEFTGTGTTLALPLVLAVAAATVSSQLVDARR